MANRKPTHFEATGQLCILSVDDDAVNLMVVEQLLPSDWRVISAQDSHEALAALEEESWPDFIFLDYQMASDCNGDEICRRMRKIFGSMPIPIVMCTAMTAGSHALQDCKEAGATDFLLKPYERTRMLEKVNLYCADKVQASRPPTATQPPVITAGPLALQAVHQPAQPLQPDLLTFCVNLDLEIVGRKLADAGLTLAQLRAMDDVALRKAGVVVKSQREKIMQALTAVPAL